MKNPSSLDLVQIEDTIKIHFDILILLSPLADRVNSPPTSGIIDRSVESSWNQQKESLFFSETNRKSHSFSKETPLQKVT